MIVLIVDILTRILFLFSHRIFTKHVFEPLPWTVAAHGPESTTRCAKWPKNVTIQRTRVMRFGIKKQDFPYQ
jgi:hypothetical protein